MFVCAPSNGSFTKIVHVCVRHVLLYVQALGKLLKISRFEAGDFAAWVRPRCRLVLLVGDLDVLIHDTFR